MAKRNRIFHKRDLPRNHPKLKRSHPFRVHQLKAPPRSSPRRQRLRSYKLMPKLKRRRRKKRRKKRPKLKKTKRRKLRQSLRLLIKMPLMERPKKRRKSRRKKMMMQPPKSNNHKITAKSCKKKRLFKGKPKKRRN